MSTPALMLTLTSAALLVAQAANAECQSAYGSVIQKGDSIAIIDSRLSVGVYSQIDDADSRIVDPGTVVEVLSYANAPDCEVKLFTRDRGMYSTRSTRTLKETEESDGIRRHDTAVIHQRSKTDIAFIRNVYEGGRVIYTLLGVSDDPMSTRTKSLKAKVPVYAIEAINDEGDLHVISFRKGDAVKFLHKSARKYATGAPFDPQLDNRGTVQDAFKDGTLLIQTIQGHWVLVNAWHVTKRGRRTG